MRGLIEYKKAILQATKVEQLQRVIEEVCRQGRYQMNETLDYADNAIIAEMNLRHGVAELLRLAHKRRAVL